MSVYGILFVTQLNIYIKAVIAIKKKDGLQSHFYRKKCIIK